MLSCVFFAIGIVLLFPATSSAATAYLTDGTVLEGEIESVDSQRILVKTSGGTMSVTASSLEKIIFRNRVADDRLSSPQKTFQFWMHSAKNLDIEGMVRCYAAYSQVQKRNELLAIKADELASQKKAFERSTFSISEPLVLGNRATLKIERKIGETEQMEMFEFVLENGEWKIIP